METTLDRMIEFLISQSTHLAVLFAVIAVFTWLLNKRSAHVRYLLWLLILAKCLIPPPLTSSAGGPARTGGKPRDIPPRPQQAEYEPTSTAAQPQQPYIVVKDQADSAAGPAIRATHCYPQSGGDYLDLRIYFIPDVDLCIRAVRFQIRLKQLRSAPDESLKKEIADLAERFWPGLKVRAYLLEGIGQPFVWGLWRGAIYLPANFTRTTAGRKRHAVLLHEIAHIARADVLVNLIQSIAQGIYWFHPLVWIANRIIRAEREKCCDETAIAKLKTTPKEYGGAIVEVLTAEYQSRLAIPSLAVAGPSKNIEDRLKTIMNPKRRFYARPTFIGLCMVLFLASIIVPTAIALTHKKLKPEDLTPPFEVSGTVTDAQTGQPIERAIVFDDGYGPTPRQETTTDPNGTFCYKTWNEEHNITAKADGYEVQTLVLKTFPFGNSDNLHFKLKSQTPPITGPAEEIIEAQAFIAEVPEIGKVELVSVCPLQSQKDYLGWDPDGGPLSQMLYADRFMQEEEDAKPVSFVLRTDSNIFVKEFRSDQLFQTRRNWSNSNGIRNAKDDRVTRKDNPYYYSLQGLFRPESTAADLSLLIQRDQWTLRVIYDGKYMTGKTDTRVRFLESYDSAGGVKVVFDHDYEGMDIRLEATCIDTSGNGQQDRTVSSGVSEVTNSEGRKHHLAFFSNITLSTIREIRLQTRPQKYTQVRFKNVALQPIVHSAGQTKTEDELQTADKVQAATISDAGRQNLNLDTGDVRSGLSLDDKLRYGIDLSLERYGLDKKGDPQITALNMAFREMDVPQDTPLEEISPEKIEACFPLSAFPVNQPRVVVEWNTNPIFVFQTQEGAAGIVRATWENYSVNTPCQIQYCLLPERSVPLVQYSWGPPAEGLSCRLRPSPAAGRMGGPTLALDLRNQSEKPYSFVSVPAAHYEIELDGQWHGYAETPAVDAPVYTLAPNHVCPDGLAINLNELEGSWALPADGKPLRYAPGVARAWGERLKLTPGRHTIRLRFRPREWLEQDNQGQEEPFVLSNPITIDIPDPLEAENGIPLRPESKTQADREAEKPEAAVDSMRISFAKGVPLTDALQMLSKYYKQTIIPSQAVIDARDKVPVTDLYDVTSLEMALEAILGTNRYVKDGSFIRVYTTEEYDALPPEEKAESEIGLTGAVGGEMEKKEEYVLRLYDLQRYLDLRRQKALRADPNNTSGDAAITPQALAEEIQKAIAPKSWVQNGGPGRISVYEGSKLLIHQISPVHQQIAEYLGNKNKVLELEMGIRGSSTCYVPPKTGTQ